MVNCPECGNEIEVIKQDGKYIAGCWSEVHEAPDVESLNVLPGDVWPITGNPMPTEQEAIESFKQYWI